jgi:hypothetical protein
MKVNLVPNLLCFIIPIICIIILVLPLLNVTIDYGVYNRVAAAAAAQKTTTTSPDLAKVLIDNAIQELQSNNIDKTIEHLKAAEHELLLLAAMENNHHYHPSIQSLSTLLLLKDVIQSLEKGHVDEALVYLNLADQQLGRNLLNLSPNANRMTSILTEPFLIYTNSKYGIKIQYQYNWIVEGNSYATGAGGIQITSFYLPDVSNGLPFFRIGVDNLSKEFPQSPVVSINEYLNRSLEHKNSTGFPGFKLIVSNTNNTLAGNRAYTVVWTYTHPIYGIRKSIEIATIIGSKGYFIDYTAAVPKFSNYLPIAEKMIESFEIIK